MNEIIDMLEKVNNPVVLENLQQLIKEYIAYYSNSQRNGES